MSVAARCFLLLAVLLAGGVTAATADGAPETTTRTVAGSPMDTSWGDEHDRPVQ
ncbi:hypothetical protein GCM10010275_16500 [Streptomyces litmocidini]|uniref:hypothetical protein n=1 Tax=Streptomyces litmocidini TaxID=67318 RepID=UPI00167E1E3D|nr:hypothetical protein [Streptomyces litmocidini]GGU82128.1 hypothetical protein GCM10010275_16500 [Streptomyces litmocidini]